MQTMRPARPCNWQMEVGTTSLAFESVLVLRFGEVSIRQPRQAHISKKYLLLDPLDPVGLSEKILLPLFLRASVFAQGLLLR